MHGYHIKKMISSQFQDFFGTNTFHVLNEAYLDQ